MFFKTNLSKYDYHFRIQSWLFVKKKKSITENKVIIAWQTKYEREVKVCMGGEDHPRCLGCVVHMEARALGV